jgi:hypothetical protein
VIYFLERMNGLLEDYPPELVFNMDETRWRPYEAPRRLLEEKARRQ